MRPVQGPHLLISFLLITLPFTLLVKAQQSDEKIEKPMACHVTRDDKNLVQDAKLEEINEKLQQLYKEIDKEAEYEQDCTYNIESGEGKEFVVTELLERLEFRRDNYKHGLWGFCGEEGAKKLIEDIQAIKKRAEEEKAKNMSITICNRDKFLNCHKKYKKCQCLEDYRNFRNVESEYWNNSKLEADHPHKDILMEDQCVLNIESDCPIAPTAFNFSCKPGTTCLFKNTLLPCEKGNLEESMKRSMFGYKRYKREEPSEEKEETPGSSSDAEKGGEPRVTESDSGYSMIRDDYPSLYCECIGFNGKYHKSSAEPIMSKISGILTTNLAFPLIVSVFQA